MSATTDNLAMLFSSTERRKGESAAGDRAIQLSSSSDTQVTAFVRSSSPARVTLSTSDVGGSEIVAKCTCSVAKKDQLCRHVWAALLKLEEQEHDFLLGKESISVASKNDVRGSAESHGAADTDDATVYRYGSESEGETARKSRLRKQTAFKERQKALAKEYRRQKAQKQKTREHAFNYPSHVEEARRYFQANGFEMKQPFELSEIVDAKKQLSRVFHPDKGGSHDEILKLNRNFQILSDYLKS